MIDHAGSIDTVTGSARGIGRAVAKTLAAGGAYVAILDINEEGARAAAEELEAQYSVRTSSGSLDVADKETVVEAFQRLSEEFGHIDILVNNAAITTNINMIADMPMENWDREIGMNLSGAFYCAKQVLPGTVERKWGRIVNVSSAAGAMGGCGQCSYAASKAGPLCLTKTIALEYARNNVAANALSWRFRRSMQ